VKAKRRNVAKFHPVEDRAEPAHFSHNGIPVASAVEIETLAGGPGAAQSRAGPRSGPAKATEENFMTRCPRNRFAAFAAAFVLLTLMTRTTATQAGEEKTITIGEVKTIESKVLGETRSILVHLPTGYNITTDAYPVLYLLDGKEQFLHTAGLVDFLGTRGAAPQMIVVGIVNTDRGRDFTQSKVAKGMAPTKMVGGGAEKFLTFIEQELTPFVEQTYRTQPYRILVGHSLGGLLATYSMLTRPGLFDAYLAISPALGWDDGLIFRDMATALERRRGAKGFFYATYGGLEGKEYDTPLRELRKTLKKHAGGLDWIVTRMPNDDHGTIVHAAIYTGLRHLFKGWRMGDGVVDLDGVRKHYAQLSKRFGYEIRVPEQTVNLMAYGYLLKGKEIDKAIAIFEENVRLYPQSPNVYDSLGEGYEAAGQLDKAIEYYGIAIKKLSQVPNHDKKVMQIYREHVTRAKTAKKGGKVAK